VSAQRVMDGDHFDRVMNGYFFVIYRFSPPSATGTP
jgi:hypothetical protein